MKEPEFTYIKVSTADLTIDPLYQRPLSKSRVNRIVKNFNPYLVNDIKCSKRDGKMYVFDGQHTLAALRTLHGGKDCLVQAKVFYGLTVVDEVELFVLQTGESAKVIFPDKIKALVNVGDKEACGYVNAVERSGYRFAYYSSGTPAPYVAPVSVGAYKLYKNKGADALTSLYSTLAHAYSGNPECLKGSFFSGVCFFYSQYWGLFDDERLTERLRRHSIYEIVQACTVMQKKNATRAIAWKLRDIYNSRLMEANKLPVKFSL